MQDIDWQPGSIELNPSHPDSGGKVCVLWNPPGRPTQRVIFDPSLFPADAPLREAQPVEWRIVDNKPEIRIPPPVLWAPGERERAHQQATDTIRAGGAEPIDERELLRRC